MSTISNIIFFIKKYFISDSFALTTTWRTTMTFSWFRKSIEGHKWFIPEWTRWMMKNTCCSFFSVYQICREIWWNFFIKFVRRFDEVLSFVVKSFIKFVGRFDELFSFVFSRTKLSLDFLTKIFLFEFF